jgi:hypothetical protein
MNRGRLVAAAFFTLLAIDSPAVARSMAMTDADGARAQSHAAGYGSFAGSCRVKGSVHFDPPATNQQQDLSYAYRGTGTCTGTLNGRSVDGALVAMAHAGTSNASCNKAQTVGPGHGRLTFAGGTIIRYTVTFTSVATEVDFQFEGQRAGTATGHGTFLTSRTPPDVAVHCATDGVTNTPLDIDLSTQSALTSR